jgi:hypothetical protein
MIGSLLLVLLGFLVALQSTVFRQQFCQQVRFRRRMPISLRFCVRWI